MNAAAILAIPVDQPERLFKTPTLLRSEFGGLVMEWHPDRNKAPEAAAVVDHIQALYRAAQQRIKAGLWSPANEMHVTAVTGKKYRIRFRKRHAFELGEMLVGMHFVTFVIDKKHENLMLRGVKRIGSLKYPTEQFRRSIGPLMPAIGRNIETAEKWIISTRKQPDEVLLSDLIAYLGGKIEAKHTAWVISRLLNLACFLTVANISHNGISPTTVFVSPQKHAAALYGGWWYAVDPGKLITHLPPATYQLASRRLLAHKIATHELDLESIKAVGRACLGDLSGGSLRGSADIPAPIAQWLQMPPAKTAFAEYERWPKILSDSFGPRRFHQLPITGEDVYPEGT